jgi:hypothetical protein
MTILMRPPRRLLKADSPLVPHLGRQHVSISKTGFLSASDVAALYRPANLKVPQPQRGSAFLESLIAGATKVTLGSCEHRSVAVGFAGR